MSRPTLTRRGLLGSAAIAGVATMAGCSFERTTGGDASGGNDEDRQYTIDTLNMNCFGARPTFVKNFSPSSPAEGVVGTAFLYESLLWTDRADGNTLKPWLAKEFEFDREARTMTITLRDDATWSDGKPVTADDVMYTVIDLPKQAEQQQATVTEYDFEAAKVDDLTVKFTWPEDNPDIEGDRTVGEIQPMPKHVFEKQDLSTWTNADDPVSSTPLTLERFTPQQVTFSVRDDHFNGPIPHVKKLNWVTYGSADIGRNLMLQGKMDWATMSLQNPDKTFVEQGEGNRYWSIYANNAESLIFNCAKPPFDDPAVRKAVYAALDTDKLHSLFDIGLPSISPTGLDPQVWGDMVKPELAEPHKADPAAAKQYLTDAGWTVKGGNLTKEGKSYPVSYKVVTEYVNWSTWSDGIKQQLKSVLGLDIKVLKVPDAQIFSQYDKGEFELGMTWMAAGTHIATVYAGLHSSGAEPLGKESSSNPQRVKDPELDKLLDAAERETDETKLREIAYQLEQLVVDKCYIAPVNPGANFIEATGTNWTGWPEEITADQPVPLAYGTADTWKMMQALVPTK